MTKDECKNKIARNNNFDSFENAIRYTFNRDLLHSEEVFIDKLINEAMQEYSDQENERLKAVVSKQDELIVYLKAVTISHCPNKEEEDRLLSELEKLNDRD